MSKVDIDPANQGDIPPTPSTGPSNAPVPLPYDEWVPAGEPVGQLPEGQDFYECFLSNAAGQFLNTYTMRVDSPYSFEASDRLGTNQSVAAFELEGVLFNRNQLFASQAPPSASLNGATLVTATWVPGPRQHCVRATWTLDVLRSGGYLRNGTFRIESASADTVLYVRSAVLRLNGESTNQNNSSVSASTNATETALPTPVPASSSSTPNLGVIIPAILVPIFAIAGVIVAFVFWRRRQQHRRRLAPSAAFRQDHAATIARGVEGHGAASPVPSNANAYIPLDEKRSFNFS